MPDKPTILLIVATYNCADALPRCIDNYVNQSYDNKKLVIIDGASTDGTIDVIHRYQDHIDYWISERDRGIYDAWNKALECGIKADWIQFIGGDDHYKDNQVLERVAGVLFRIYTQYYFAYAKTEVLWGSGVTEVLGIPWNVDQIISKGGLPGGQVSFFYHRSLFQRYGLFDKSYKISGDLEHFLRFVKRERGYFIHDVISTVHHIGGVSTNPSHDWIHWKERERAFEQHGFRYKKTLIYRYIKFVRYLKYGVYRIFGERCLNSMVNIVQKQTGGRKHQLFPQIKYK